MYFHCIITNLITVTEGTTANDMGSESALFLHRTLRCTQRSQLNILIWLCVGYKDEKYMNAADGTDRDWCLMGVCGDAGEKTPRGHSWGVWSPPRWRSRSPLLEACVYVSLRVFPPTARHPILLNKGAWGSGVKWEWAHEWKGTNWHVAFCEVSAQPLDRWLPFANEHPGLCVSAFLSASLQNVLSPLQLCAGLEWPVDHRCAVNWETHTSVIKAVGGLVLYQLLPIPLL